MQSEVKRGFKVRETFPKGVEKKCKLKNNEEEK